MQGRSHLLFALTAGVVVDSVLHVSGAPLTGGDKVSLALLINKAVFYTAVGFGSLLPDIDNARSSLGNDVPWLSRGINKLVGHRTVLHSFLGLFIGAILAIGIEQVVIFLLNLKGLGLPAFTVSNSHIFFWGTLIGSMLHIFCDALTYSGVPLLWPLDYRFGYPFTSKLRFKTGTWPESVIVWGTMLLVVVGIFTSVIIL